MPKLDERQPDSDRKIDTFMRLSHEARERLKAAIDRGECSSLTGAVEKAAKLLTPHLPAKKARKQ